MKENQQKQIAQVICLNIYSSTHTDEVPHRNTYSPQIVAMKWQSRPARKIDKVFRVRQTYPQGMTLLMQQSRRPTIQSTDRRAVPPTTIAEPQKMKLRNYMFSVSVQVSCSQICLVTQATMKTPRLFIWAGMLKGSISCRMGPSCFGIYISKIYNARPKQQLTRLISSSTIFYLYDMNHPPTKITFLRRPPKTLSTSQHIIETKSVLRFNYCKPSTTFIPSISINYPPPEQPFQMQSSRISEKSHGLSVVSKEMRESQTRKNDFGELEILSIKDREYEGQGIFKTSNNVDRLSQKSQQDANPINIQFNSSNSKLYSMPSHIKAYPLIESITCDLLPCKEGPAGLQGAPNQELLPAGDISSNKTMSDLDKSLKSDTQPLLIKQIQIKSIASSKRSSEAKITSRQNKLIHESQQQLNWFDIPPNILGRWEKTASTGEGGLGEDRSVEIAPFRLSQRRQ